MTKRAEQFLEALPRATQRFVHIEVELLREVLALVRERLQEQLRRAEAERDKWSDQYAAEVESSKARTANLHELLLAATAERDEALADVKQHHDRIMTLACEQFDALAERNALRAKLAALAGATEKTLWACKVLGHAPDEVLAPDEKPCGLCESLPPLQVAVAEARKDAPLDGCSRCRGGRGGVPGNENIIDGRVLCDYCSADDLALKKANDERNEARATIEQLRGFVDSASNGVAVIESLRAELAALKKAAINVRPYLSSHSDYQERLIETFCKAIDEADKSV